MSSLLEFFAYQATSPFLSWDLQLLLAKQFKVSIAEVEATALRCNILPLRYQKSLRNISIMERKDIFFSHVAVTGCGQLGGYIAEGLSRIGVGHLTLIDSGIIEEATLSQHPFIGPSWLGRNKVDAVANLTKEVNPAVTVTPVVQDVNLGNGCGLLAGTEVVVDALYSTNARLMVCNICEKLELPLINGLSLASLRTDKHCQAEHDATKMQQNDRKEDAYTTSPQSLTLLAENIIEATLDVLLRSG